MLDYSQASCKKKLNNWFLARYIGVIGLSTMQFGQVLTSNNAVGPILAERLKWENPDLNNTYIASVSVLGMAIGCLFGGILVKAGRRKMMILMNLIAAIGIGVTMELNLYAILVGKFIWAFAVGVLSTAGPLMVSETIPAEEMSFWGTSSNLFIVIAMSITYACGIGLPESGSPEVFTSDYWRVVYGYPLINISIVLICFTCVYQYDSLQFLLTKKEHTEALQLIHCIYTKDSDHHQILQEMIDNQKVKENLNLTLPSMTVCLTQNGLWQPQWVCIANAMFNQLTGINAINVYSITIFTNMEKAGGTISPLIGTQLVGLAGVLGALLGPLVLKYTTRRQLFVGSELLMSVWLFLTGLFTFLHMSELTLAAIFLFVVTYQSTTGGAFWVYTGEVCNEKQLGVCLMALMLGILAMTLFTDTLMSSPLHTCGTFWLFSALSLFGSLFLNFTMKETKDLSREEQMSLWHSKSKRYSLRSQITMRQSERLTASQKQILPDIEDNYKPKMNNYNGFSESASTNHLLPDMEDNFKQKNFNAFSSVATTATGGSV